MTVEVHGSGSANPWGDLGDVGLEDVGAGDIRMPRIQIDHEKAVFRNTTTNEEFAELDCVVLGLVKQRIMWDSQVDDGDKPQCKSPNFEIGYPQMREDIPARKQFPWDKSNFNKADMTPDQDGLIALPCGACNLKEWGKDRERPPCSEQYTFAIYYVGTGGEMVPAILSFQKSGIKAAKTYAGTFGARRQPMFTVWTKMTLTPESRGKTRYAVPTLARGGASDQSEWMGYGEAYRSVREYLHAKPRVADDQQNSGSTKPVASAVKATVVDEDDPWATSAPAASSGPAAKNDDLPF